MVAALAYWHCPPYTTELERAVHTQALAFFHEVGIMSAGLAVAKSVGYGSGVFSERTNFNPILSVALQLRLVEHQIIVSISFLISLIRVSSRL